MSTAGELEASVDDYATVLEIEADHVEATFHRGTVYEKLGKLDKAIADFSKVLSLEPDHVKASYARGTCRNLKGDFAPAIGMFLLTNAQQHHHFSDIHTWQTTSLLVSCLSACCLTLNNHPSTHCLTVGPLGLASFLLHLLPSCLQLASQPPQEACMCRGLCQGIGEGQAGIEATPQESRPAWC